MILYIYNIKIVYYTYKLLYSAMSLCETWNRLTIIETFVPNGKFFFVPNLLLFVTFACVK